MDWQVIVTLIIAIITAFVAYLNYRTRPLLVRTKEKHSEELKGVLERWLSELDKNEPSSPSWWKVHESWEPSVEVESTPLFFDLAEHLPARVSLLAEWENIKKTCRSYNTERSRLYNRICNDVQEVGQGLFPAEVITKNFADVIYDDASRLARGEPQRVLDRDLKVESQITQTPTGPKPWFQFQVYGRRLASGETERQVTMAVSYLRGALENLSKAGTREAGYVDKAKKLKEIEDALIEQNEKLRQSIKDVLAIPILTGDCRYIKQATESFFPFNIKRIFRVRLPRKRRQR